MSRAEREIARSVVGQLRNQARQASWASDPARWASDVLGVHMWSKQREISTSVVDHKRTVVASCHGTGKALEVSTPVHTPSGPKPMGDIAQGMKVLGSAGEPVDVVATTGIHTATSYRITLENSGVYEEIVASGEHVWPVLHEEALLRAEEATSRVGLGVHTGLWHHASRMIDTSSLYRNFKEGRDQVIPSRVPSTPFVGPSWEPGRWAREVFDRRGCTDVMGRPALVWMSQSEVSMPKEVAESRSFFSDKSISTLLHRRTLDEMALWTLTVSNSPAVSLLPIPDDRAVAQTSFLHDRSIPVHPGWKVVDVKRVGEKEVQCIQVDAPDHLYLCGEQEIPTHNSMIASVLACWWISTRPIGEAIVVSTAPTYAQVNKILWEEIRKHHATSRHRNIPMVGRVTQGDEWKTDDGQILAFGRKPAHGDRHGFQGIHRRYVLAILDEACGIPEEIWTGVEAITTNTGCRILAIGNPDDRNTEFGNVFLKDESRQDWNRVSVPASSTPNFTGEEVPSLLNEVLVSKPWCEERLRAWGKDDPRYISKVEARFPEQSQSSLFPPALIAAAMEDAPPQPVGPVVRLGVDVARFGGDLNVVISHAGVTARVEDTWSGTDTVSSAHRVLKIAEDLKERLKASWVEIRVDAVGLGAGVVDTLNARGVLLPDPWFSVYELHGSASPPVDVGGSVHGYGNARAYWFDQLRHQMRNGGVRIEEHEQVKEDLGTVFYEFRTGRLFIISKEKMRKDHGRSPDYADALAYATAPVAEGLPVGSTVSDSADAVSEVMEDMIDLADMSIAPY